ncbi:hypothetical protein LXT12_17170 [Pelomonas sp. P7]|uniref:Uncharacterized protein n=1 Tax=Pelomonas caseinilytica TaxID=2906763 RepID=A0ABS8XDI7_9BURK|nr:hypothetical protein [Pelomonas sp. P7]MCE4538984.1 hypothetical protein [Pelomonas sp. P7]
MNARALAHLQYPDKAATLLRDGLQALPETPAAAALRREMAAALAGLGH